MPLSPRTHPWQPAAFIAGLVAFAMLVGGLSALSYQRFRLEAEANAGNLAQVISLGMEETLGRAEGYLLGIAHFLRAEDFTSGLTKPRQDEIEALMADLLRHFPEISGYRVFTAEGDAVLSAGKSAPADIRVGDRAWFRSLKLDPARMLALSDVDVGHGPNAPSAIVAVAIRAPGGQLQGVVSAALHLAHIQRLLDGPEIGPKGMISLSRSDTAQLLLRRPESAGQINQPFNSPFAARILAGETAGIMELVYAADNVSRIAAFRRTQHYPLVVTVGLARDDTLRPWMIQTVAAWNVALAFVVLLAALYFRQRRKVMALETESSEAQLHAQRYESLLHSASEGICGVDADGLVNFINAAALSMLGWREDEVIGHNFHMLVHRHHYHPDGTGYPAFDCRLHTTITAREAGSESEERQFREDVYWHKDGDTVQVEASVTAIKGESKAGGAVIIFRDLSARKKRAEQARRLAFYDALTNLPKRRLLNDRLNLAMAASKRSGRHGAVMFLVLDHFKSLNDIHGQAIVDTLLVELAGRLKTCVRDMDTVARFDRGEFVVMIGELDVSHAESIAQAGIIAEKIRSALSKPFLQSLAQPNAAGGHHCTVSIGVALFGVQDISPEAIYKCAAKAMFQARKAGRNSVRFYDGSPEGEAA